MSRGCKIQSLVAKRFTAEHEAVVFDDTTGMGVVSITDHAQSSLGDVVFVELPSIGTEVLQGGKPTSSCTPKAGAKTFSSQIRLVLLKASKQLRT
jgi:glycine cleavage system H protein